MSAGELLSSTLHMFGGGATGFSFFIDSCIDDAAKMLALATAVQYAVHFEDHFLDGVPLLPGIDVTEDGQNNVRAWSGVRLASSAWVVVTASNPTQPSLFVMRVSDPTTRYVLCDLTTGARVDLGNGPDLHIAVDASAVASVASVLHIAPDADSTCLERSLPPDAWLPR